MVRHASGAEQGPSHKLPSPSLRVGRREVGSPGPEVGQAWPARGTPARVWLCGCWVHASGISARLPGLLTGGEGQEEELHKGRLVGGPCFFRGSPPPREGRAAPGFPGKSHACHPLSAAPATGVWAASPLSSCLPLSLALPPLRTVPASGPQSARSLPPPPSQLQLRPPSPREGFPHSPLTCPLSRRPLQPALTAGLGVVRCSIISGA